MTRRRRRPPAVLVILLVGFVLVTAACSDGRGITTAGQTTSITIDSIVDSTLGPTSSAVPTTQAPPTTKEPGVQKPYGGTAVIAELREPLTLNPFAPGGDSAVVAKIAQLHSSGVQEIDGSTLELVPELVTELPTTANGGVTINPDGTMTVRYTIREEARWADGTPVSGADFLFTYQTIMDLENFESRAVYEDILEETIVLGDKSFEYTLRAPTTRAELIFDRIIPEHAVAGTDFLDDWNDTMWTSSGPFIVEHWERGQFLSLVRNPGYWQVDPETEQQLPYLDRILFRFIPEVPSIINLFKAREIDIITLPRVPEVIADLQSVEGVHVEVLPSPVWQHLSFQFGENRLARNPNSYNEFLEYRRAIAHAIDVERITREIFDGYAPPLDSFVTSYTPGFSQGSWGRYPYDPERARQLLEELCARADTDCESRPPRAVLSVGSGDQTGVLLTEMLAEMFADVGLGFESAVEDTVRFYDSLDSGSFDLAVWAWRGAPGVDALLAITKAWDPKGPPPLGFNKARWGTPEVVGEGPPFDQGPSALVDENSRSYAELVDEMLTTHDRQKLIPLIQEAEQILASQAIFIPLYALPDAGAVWADEIGGYTHNTSMAGDTWNAASWYRADLLDS